MIKLECSRKASEKPRCPSMVQRACPVCVRMRRKDREEMFINEMKEIEVSMKI